MLLIIKQKDNYLAKKLFLNNIVVQYYNKNFVFK